MQLQENPARVLLGLHGNSTEGFLLKNLYYLEFKQAIKHTCQTNIYNIILKDKKTLKSSKFY